MRCYLFDIDGTIADLSHRLHYIKPEYDSRGMLPPKNYDAFFAACHLDRPIPHMWSLMNDLLNLGVRFVYVSGRSDQCRNATAEWLDRHDFPTGPIYMRTAGDHRPDHIVKGELLDKLLADGWVPIMAFDDRDQVVKMWRERGIPCAQVADGDF